MADHKHATEVAFAATDDRSGFSALVLRWWKLGLAALLLGSGTLVALQYMENAASEDAYAAWNELGGALGLNSPGGLIAADADAIANIATVDADRVSGAWARYMEAYVRELQGDPKGAIEALEKLHVDHPEHFLSGYKIAFPDSPTALTIGEHMGQALEATAAWEVDHPALFGNPAPEPGGARVRLTTTEGSILVALYSEAAPNHAANFVKLCSEGFYDGTKFHAVIENVRVQGGDPNSKELDVDLWGKGGPGQTLALEQNDLRHFEGAVAAYRDFGETESNGSQFYITTKDTHVLDGQGVIFGIVVEGMETLDIIDSAAIVPGTMRPETPAAITSTEVL